MTKTFRLVARLGSEHRLIMLKISCRPRSSLRSCFSI